MNNYLKQKGISTGVHCIPNNHYDMYKKIGGKTPVSDAVWKKILTRPLYPDLRPEEVELIIDSVSEFVK